MSPEINLDPSQVSQTISLIVAMSENLVIGRDNKLPWKIPGDLQYFREVTWGKPIIMGRKTFDSLKRPLPGRANIVITRDKNYQGVEGIKVVNSIEQAITVAKSIADIDLVDEIMIIGGAQIYQQSLLLVDRMYITQIDANIEGDAFFPAFDQKEWSLINQKTIPADEKTHAHSYLVFDKVVMV